MKKGLLLTSVLSIAMLASITAGATYALFMVEDETNIAINAGTVEVEAFVNKDSLRTYSMGVEQLNGKFENGGEATFDAASNLRLDLLTPGDKATFTVQINNHSDVHVKYRLSLAMGGELADGLVSKAVIDGTEYSLRGSETRWIELLAGEDIPDVLIEVELPTEAGNEYCAKSAEINVKVEAAQRNAEIADTWNGTVNTEWYDASNSEYVIYTAEELAGLATLTNTTGNSFAGKTVVLGSHIDLKGLEWSPIGSTTSFQGTFDGNGYTISNLAVNRANYGNVGFFAKTENGEVRNVTFKNAEVSGYTCVGVVAGVPYTTKYTNINIEGHVEVNGFAYAGALGGKDCYANVTNVTVNTDATSYVKADSRSGSLAYRTYVGGVIGFMGEGEHTLENITSNIDVYGTICDVGGIVGIAHYGNKLINCTSTGDVAITNALEYGDCYEMGGIAGVWHNQTGYRVTLTNCTYEGTLSATYYEAGEAKSFTDFQYGGLVGKAYSSTGLGILDIDGVEYSLS